MKLTESEINKIVEEELQKFIKENNLDEGFFDYFKRNPNLAKGKATGTRADDWSAKGKAQGTRALPKPPAKPKGYVNTAKGKAQGTRALDANEPTRPKPNRSLSFAKGTRE